MTIFRGAAFGAILALALTACGHHSGMLPPQDEQQAIQSMVVGAPANEPVGHFAAHHGMGMMLQGLNLTQQQQDQIHTIVVQFRQAHPTGSRFDPQSFRDLRDRMIAVLTPDQLARLQQNMLQWHHHMHLWDLNLTQAQRTQIRQLMVQYRQAHPRGSAFDPQARQQLHQQILNVLTPEQRAQVQQRFTQSREAPPNPQR